MGTKGISDTKTTGRLTVGRKINLNLNVSPMPGELGYPVHGGLVNTGVWPSRLVESQKQGQ
jgi:hypothetical protein